MPTGNYVKEKSLRLPDIMRCGVPSNSSIAIQVGNNIQVSCSFNFLYLVQRMTTHTYQNYLYELFIEGQNGEYFQVPVYINSGTTAASRFYL